MGHVESMILPYQAEQVAQLDLGAGGTRSLYAAKELLAGFDRHGVGLVHLGTWSGRAFADQFSVVPDNDCSWVMSGLLYL